MRSEAVLFLLHQNGQRSLPLDNSWPGALTETLKIPAHPSQKKGKVCSVGERVYVHHTGTTIPLSSRECVSKTRIQSCLPSFPCASLTPQSFLLSKLIPFSFWSRPCFILYIGFSNQGKDTRPTKSFSGSFYLLSLYGCSLLCP